VPLTVDVRVEPVLEGEPALEVVVPDAVLVPVSALAGVATASTVPPRVARPNVKMAAVLAMRALIM
jgi:hypothetical protein